MITNLPAIIEPKELINKEVEDDLSLARTNIKEIIQKTVDATDTVIDLADTSQAARYYDVLNSLLKTSIEANRELVDLHKKKIDLEHSKYGPPKTQVNNNLIMTSKDMLKLIRGEKVE